MLCKLYCTDSQKVISGPAAFFGNLKMIILRPHPRSAESETVQWGTSNLCFNKAPRDYGGRGL